MNQLKTTNMVKKIKFKETQNNIFGNTMFKKIYIYDKKNFYFFIIYYLYY